MSSFEEHINKKVKNHPTEIDTDALWNSIKEDIPKEKDKRRGVFFLFLIVGLFIIGGITILSKDSISEDGLANRIAIPDNRHISDNSERDIQDIIEELPILRQSSTSQTKGYSNSSEKTKQVKSYQTALNELDINYSSDLLNTEANSTDKNVAVTISSSIPFIVDNEEEKQEADTKLGLESIPYMLAILNLDKEEELLLAVNMENEEEPFEDSEEEEEESTSKKKKFTIQGGFHTAFGPTKSLINAKSTDYEYYANRRIGSETPEGFFEIGLDAVIKMDNGLKLRTGLSYTRIREDFALRISNLNQMPDNQEQENNNSPSLLPDGLLADINTPVSSPSSLNPIQNDRITFRNDNLYTMLDLPIILGYDLNLGKKISLGFEGGTYINLFSNADGFIAHPSGRLFKIDSGAIKSHKNNILLSTYTGLSINYEIAPKLDIQLGGQYRYTPFSITDKSYSLDQKYSAFGVSIGMLFDIN